MNKILLVVLILIPFYLFALPEKIQRYEDQLTSELGQSKIEPLAQLTKYYALEDPKRAIALAQEVLPLLTLYPDDSKSLFVIHYLIAAYFELGLFDLAESQLPSYNALAESSGTLDEQAMAAKDNSYLFLKRDNDYAQAVIYLKKALTKYQEMPADTENINLAIAATLNDIGLMHYYNDNFDKALHFYFQALDIHGYAESIYATLVYGNIALVHKEYQRYDDALIYFNRALTHAKKFKRLSKISEQLINIGATYTLKKEYDKATQYLEQAAEIEEKIGRKRSLYLIAKNLGDINKGLESFTIATDYYNTALSHANDMKSKQYIAETNVSIGNMNSKLEKFDIALTHLNTALKLAKEIEFEAILMRSHQSIYKIHHALGDFEKAYLHLASYYQLKEIRLEQNRLKKVSELEQGYKATQRESEIQLLTKDNELENLKFQRFRNSSIGIFIFVIFITVFLVYRQMHKRKLAADRAEMMAELVENKNQLLADVSHELRTPLTVLQLKVEALQHNLVKDVDASYESLIAKISDINKLITDIYQLAQSDIGALQLDIKSHQCENTIKKWSVELAELANIKGFKWQQNIEWCNEVVVDFDKDRLKQVVCNLVDNSIAYTDTPGVIRLLAKVSKTHLEIKIEDSSPGVSNDNLPKLFERLFRIESSRSRATGGSGLGLAICKSIIVAHHGEIISSRSKLGGLAIVIRLPLQAKN